MPIPSKKKDENKQDYIERCMSDNLMNKEYPSESQRYAICSGKSSSSIFFESLEYLNDRVLGYTEDVNLNDGIHVPDINDYINLDDELFEDYYLEEMANRDLDGIHMYMDPKTREIYIFNKKGVHYKNGQPLVLVAKASEYQGRKVTLNKPFRTPNGPKKFSVYVKNEKGNVVKVNFGDPNMSIKKNNPERRKSFRARHGCDKNPGPKWKAKYWSCQWSW
jgi:hypothetical protein